VGADLTTHWTQLYRNRQMPEGMGIWVGMSLTSTSGRDTIPDDQTMWGLKHRGVVPVFMIDADLTAASRTLATAARRLVPVAMGKSPLMATTKSPPSS
jgi:hypothetical protein